MGSVLLKRFYHEGLAQASYLVGCQRTGEALVVDATRDVDQYVRAARANGLRVSHVTETHIHADFLSGSRELAAVTGAELLLSAEGGQDWQYAFAREANATLLRDGDHFLVGQVRVDVVHTPGHTPEHLMFVVTDRVASERPVGACTGDFVFVGDVGRPDLLERAAGVEGTMRAGAKLLFESIRRFTEHYPDYLQLWPGHGAGSACGKSLGAVPQSTLGYEKLVNWAFQIDDEARFVEAVLEGQPDAPPYFGLMKRLNREGPLPLGGLPAPPQRTPADLSLVIARGDCVIDIRRADHFAEGFVSGTVNIPLNRGFVGYAGHVVPYDRDLYLLTDGDDDHRVRHAAAELAMIGLDRVAGWFGADVFAMRAMTHDELRRYARIDERALMAGLERQAATVVDVRSTDEWDAGHIAGSIFAPLSRVSEVMAGRRRDARLVLVCQTGSRSAIAASLLARDGFTDVANLRNGLVAWERAGLPLEREAAIAAAAS
jgi:hydroxyacylglutathione hydrolase